jgi:flagellar capping protein FliD
MDELNKDITKNLDILNTELKKISESIENKHESIKREYHFLDNLLTNTINNFHIIVKNLDE